MSDQPASTNPPAGWYREPSTGQARWWDGASWGQYQAHASSAPVASAAPAQVIHVAAVMPPSNGFAIAALILGIWGFATTWIPLFIGLFVVVHGVEVGGLLALLGNKLVAATGGNMAHAGYAILWASAVLSAIVDNIPFVATMIPLIKSMAPAYGGADKIEPLWWCLSLGACLGGNGTLIGASANLTVAGIAERNGVPFKFITYTLYAFPMMLVSVAISHVYVWWRYF